MAGLETNTLWDGLFHAATWLATVAGLYGLWRATRRAGGWSGRRLLGLMLAGWGLFNLVEGLVDHHLLGIHHVRAGAGQSAYDVAFLVLGAALLAGGLTLARRPTRTATRPPPRPAEPRRVAAPSPDGSRAHFSKERVAVGFKVRSGCGDVGEGEDRVGDVGGAVAALPNVY